MFSRTNMPSANVNVGLSEGRSSSRILKPPGGGHSDIFGRDAPNAERYVRNKDSVQLSGIQACLYMEESNQPLNGKDNGVALLVTNAGEDGAASANNTGELKEVQEVKQAPVPAPAPVSAPAFHKVRMPPGGYSNGFW